MPEKSLVLLSIDAGELGSVMRVDLSDAVDEQISRLAEVAAAAGPEAAIAVIVDEDGAGCPMCNDDYRDLCSSLTDELLQRDITLWAVHVVDPFDIPTDWSRYLSIDFGYTNPFVAQWWALDHDGRLY